MRPAARCAYVDSAIAFITEAGAPDPARFEAYQRTDHILDGLAGAADYALVEGKPPGEGVLAWSESALQRQVGYGTNTGVLTSEVVADSERAGRALVAGGGRGACRSRCGGCPARLFVPDSIADALEGDDRLAALEAEVAEAQVAWSDTLLGEGAPASRDAAFGRLYDAARGGTSFVLTSDVAADISVYGLAFGDNDPILVQPDRLDEDTLFHELAGHGVQHLLERSPDYRDAYAEGFAATLRDAYEAARSQPDVRGASTSDTL